VLTLLDSPEDQSLPLPAHQCGLPRVLRRAQLASLLGVSTSTLVRMLANGQLPVAPLPWPGHPRWSRAAVSTWLGGADDLADHALRLLTVPEVAEHLGISRSSAYRALPTWVAAGQAVRCVSDWRIPLARLARLLEHA
jgi:predicted DNA-binding transcriptional regulator AlpA